MSSYSEFNTEILESNEEYYYFVSGTFSIGSQHDGDAAYSTYWNVSTPTPAMYWYRNGNGGHRPTPDIYNPERTYYFYFTGLQVAS